jgi:hypothetical protein
MSTVAKLIRPIAFALFVSSIGGCYSSTRSAYYPYGYPWYYTPYGTYAVVRRPVVVVDTWTGRTFGYRPYRGYVVRRHNSPVIQYSATKGNSTLEVDLTSLGDSTKVEVRARNGGDKYDRNQAKILMGQILQDYK